MVKRKAFIANRREEHSETSRRIWNGERSRLKMASRLNFATGKKNDYFW